MPSPPTAFTVAASPVTLASAPEPFATTASSPSVPRTIGRVLNGVGRGPARGIGLVVLHRANAGGAEVADGQRVVAADRVNVDALDVLEGQRDGAEVTGESRP